MVSPASPNIIIPAFKRLVYGTEGTTAGVAATTGLVQESCNSIVTAIQRTPYEAREYVGAAADLFGIDMTMQYATITIQVPLRVNGFAAQALMCILGNASDTAVAFGAGVASVTITTPGTGYTGTSTVAFSAPQVAGGVTATGTLVLSGGTVTGVTITNPGSGYTAAPTLTFTGGTSAAGTTTLNTQTSTKHTGIPNPGTTRCNTLTIWHDSGDRTTANAPQNVLQMTWATVESVKLTYQPTSAIMAEIVLQAQVPVPSTAPIVTSYIGSTAAFDKRRVMGYQGTFKIQGSSGLYVMPGTSSTTTNMVMSGEITLSRPIDPVSVAFNITPQDFVPGPLALAGTFDLRYDGAGAASVYQDYLNLKELGTSATFNSVNFAIDPSNSVEIDFWPIKWTQFSLSDQGQQIRSQVGFTGYNDLGTVNTASPALTVVQKVVLANQQTAAMVT